ncbi:CPBP family intramembrane glutamic endopeptidase [Mastigocoleus sp. MO_188.B34]|uniref:CPBP family intramembrane glutamic endopeptidase n=1 Tax=Mastigocoleus sp. MO_188.B34 TaxID=3036635 RepID=UPI00261E6402|nr:CPBP family intramembrane glutamic endopeptidase [Mastigocoleus sp. MO_188.B34]MDJ0698091.1 CPBP family intramembrane metalloprotease [Mastigocoleus sp. MO_188.B34]
MSKSYLEISKQGNNHWWRYLLGILTILFTWIIIGSFIVGIIAVFIVNSSLSFDETSIGTSELQEQLLKQLQTFFKTPSTEVFVTVNIQFIFFVLAIFIVVKWLHKRKFRTLINADAQINSKRLLLGFSIWFLLQLILMGVFIFIDPQNYTFSFQAEKWFPLLLFALILTPIQISAEELFFRGYLLQGMSLVTKNKFFLIIITSLLFMFPHLLNPELQRGPVWLALTYFAFGAFMSLITLKDNGLELALGTHAANNMSIFLLMNTKDSAIPTNAVWTVNETGDPRLSLVIFLLQCAVFYYILFIWKTKKLKSVI